MGWDLAWGFAAGVVLALVTTPVGVSGAVFLLPFQLSVLQVPSPSVSPTNLLYNVISVPGALLRYRRTGPIWGGLAGQVVAGTLPGMVVGACLRVFVVPGGTVFRLLVAALLATWLTSCVGAARPRVGQTAVSPPSTA